MREIKFRAYAVNEKRFLDEDELHKIMPFFSGYELLGQDPHTFVLMEDSCDPGDDGVERVTEIKWLQFTGLRDKKGIDKDYYQAAKARLERHQQQAVLPLNTSTTALQESML